VAYQSLYRRYRPAGFVDVVGQQAVLRTLANALTEDRLHHAYLFTGPRGTGKTSIARILAKAVNCVEGPTPAPCGTCESCTSITAGTSLDVIELDMASHGGVDDARDLRERAQFAPTTGRRKVYILDEVHMASTAAFNALLKLIEEPPSHVLFAMATTDPQKVLPTILSRVQRLDLRRVAAEDVAAHVARIVVAEGGSIDEQAVDAVVRAGEGSVRDTLSILEQVIAFAGGPITGEHVAQVLGTTPSATITELVDRLAARDLAGILMTVAGLVDAGQDLRRFTLDLVTHLRDLLVLQAAPGHPELVDATRERRAELVAQAGRVTGDLVLSALSALAETVAEQRQGSPRLPLELALARLALGSVTSVLAAEPVASLAADPVAATAAVPVGAAPAPASPPEPEPEPEPAPAPEPEPAPVGPGSSGGAVDLDAVIARWAGVIELVKQTSPRAKAIFEPAVPIRLQGGILTLAYGPRYASFHADQAARPEIAEVLQGALQRACALDVRIAVVRDGEDQRVRPTPPLVGGSDEDDEALAVAEASASKAAPPRPADVGALLAARLDARPEE
jgi:DNA polymerase III subunit gamma/tau